MFCLSIFYRRKLTINRSYYAALHYRWDVLIGCSAGCSAERAWVDGVWWRDHTEIHCQQRHICFSAGWCDGDICWTFTFQPNVTDFSFYVSANQMSVRALINRKLLRGKTGSHSWNWAKFTPLEQLAKIMIFQPHMDLNGFVFKRWRPDLT